MCSVTFFVKSRSADRSAAPLPPEDAASDPAPGRDGPAGAWAVAGWAAVFLCSAGLLQLLMPYPWDADTAYHVAVARLIARHGILHAFPWTPFSLLADHYADKEILFHLLLVPISGLSWVAAARIAGTLLGAALLLVLYLVLRAERVQRAGLWALLPLVASGAFVLRFALVRPHLAAIALALVAAWAALRERHLLLAGASFLYPLCYIAWQTPLFLAGLAEVARMLSGRRPRWKPAAAALLGLSAGVLVHPNAANLLRLTWLVNARILLGTAWAQAPGFDLGQEFQPFHPGEALRWLSLPLALAVTAGVIAWRERRDDPVPLGLALAALAFGAMTLRTSRFLEYLAPFSAAAFAAAASRRSWARVAAAPVLAGALALTLLFGSQPVRALGTRGDDVPPRLASYLRQVIPAASQVFTCEWGLTGELLLALPDRRFVVALDPVLFYARDPELYRLWYALPREGPPDAAALIRRRFGARFVLCTANPAWSPLLRRLAADPGVTPLLRSPLWYLYDLGEAASPRQRDVR